MHTPSTPKAPKYRIYIDEVGNSDIGSSDNPNHQFLSLTGVIVNLAYVENTLHPQMESLKRKYFESHPDDPILLHRKELVNKRPPFTALRNPEVCKRFDQELLILLRQWEYKVLTVCIDKKAHREKYETWLHDPYHYCLSVMLERFCFFLKRQGVKGDVMSESRGGQEDRRLKNSFHRLIQQGTDYVGGELFREWFTSVNLKVKTKQNNISGLQLADLIAHPSRNEVLREAGLSTKEIAPFAAKIIDILADKYDHDGRRMYGKKMLP